MSTTHQFACSVKEHWRTYMEETEKHYLEDIASVGSGRNGLEKGLKIW